MIRLLFIDDEVETQKVIKTILPDDYIVYGCTTGKRGLQHLEREEIDLVLLDLGLPDMDGMDVLRIILASDNPPPIIILTCCKSIPMVVRSMKMGAFDYLVKPFTREQLIQALQKAFLHHPRHQEPVYHELNENPILAGFIGSSSCIQMMKSLLLRYAQHKAPVLITGESGTGKDLAATILHRLSDRRHNPFLALNCAAIPDTLIETELFGSEKGAFTDAVTKPGKLEGADGGTLFLDEIGDMGLLVQAKLLRCIEGQGFTRVGGVRETRVDARIVAATNKCLEQLIEDGLFRSDLYYRLRVLTLHIQPLRERKEDIPLLTNHLVRQFPDKTYTLSSEAMEKLIHHPWPGNVRELKGVLERAIVHTTSSKIESRHILF